MHVNPEANIPTKFKQTFDQVDLPEVQTNAYRLYWIDEMIPVLISVLFIGFLSKELISLSKILFIINVLIIHF